MESALQVSIVDHVVTFRRAAITECAFWTVRISAERDAIRRDDVVTADELQPTRGFVQHDAIDVDVGRQRRCRPVTPYEGDGAHADQQCGHMPETHRLLDADAAHRARAILVPMHRGLETPSHSSVQHWGQTPKLNTV